jgi:hypothetical protein
VSNRRKIKASKEEIERRILLAGADPEDLPEGFLDSGASMLANMPPDMIQAMMTAHAQAMGGPASCHVCGDNPAFEVYWRNDPSQGGQLCDDCITIQQRMYGNRTHDVLMKVARDAD